MYTDEQRILSLSRREMTVMYLTCKGMTLQEIGIATKRRPKTVQHYRTKAYAKLDLTKFPDEQKITYLKKLYCDIIFGYIKTSEDLEHWVPIDIETGMAIEITEVEEEEDKEEERLGLVPYRKKDENESSKKEEYPIEPYKPATIKVIPAEEEGPDIWRWILIALVIGLVVYILITRNPPAEPPVIIETALVTFTADSQVEAVAEVVEITATPEVVVVVDTPLPTTPRPTATERPTSTITPTPTETPVPQPFFDPFDDGISSDWIMFDSDNYSIVDGKINAAGSFRAAVGNSSWTNYTVEFDLIDLYIYPYFTTGEGIKIMLRRQNNSNYVALHITTAYDCKFSWEVLRNGEIQEVTGSEKSLGLQTRFCQQNWKIEVSGNTYTTYVNDVQQQRLTIRGFTNGGVGVLARYTDSRNYFVLDNFRVEHLP